ncbi:MAG: PfkB family carbohydrate kinase, partial [Pseudomonadota bacterium]
SKWSASAALGRNTSIPAKSWSISARSIVSSQPQSRETVAAAREAGATVSLDCGWDETMERAEIGQLLAGIDVFLPNAAEADHLDRLGVHPQAATLAVIKRGASGASALVDGTEIHEPALGVTPVDSTGAGDAFNAGFLSAWLAAEPLAVCLRAGNATGARAIARRGGFPAAEAAPTRASALTP